ncbi:MAG: hypothetical protein KKD92_14585, partial [Proteobacteria bacterium]|nr:hypothetical protein [Pseudomonadota bacterium]
MSENDSSSPVESEHSPKANREEVCETDVKKSLIEAQKFMKEIIIRDPFKEIRDRMRTLYGEPLKEIQDRMRTLYGEPLKEIQDRMRTLYGEPLKEIQDRMRT